MLATWRQLSIWEKIPLLLGGLFFVVSIPAALMGTFMASNGMMAGGGSKGGRELALMGIVLLACSMAPALVCALVAACLRSRLPVALFRTLRAPIVVVLLGAALLEVLSGR